MRSAFFRRPSRFSAFLPRLDKEDPLDILGNPKVTITLRDPRGKLINGKTLRYTTDPAGQPGGFIPVPLGEDIQAQEWTLKAIPGV